jgi:hypothetical protein
MAQNIKNLVTVRRPEKCVKAVWQALASQAGFIHFSQAAKAMLSFPKYRKKLRFPLIDYGNPSPPGVN